MKIITRTLAFSCAFFFSMLSFAQNAEFSTPEGIKWGMTISEVKKIKIDAPLSTQQDQLMYYDLRKGDEIYVFENTKLVKISISKTLYSKKEVTNYFEEMKEEISNQYKANAVAISENLLEWTVNETKISMIKTVSKKGGFVNITYQPL